MISEKNSLSFMNVCSLVTISTTENDYGETVESEISQSLYCAEIPVTSNEFFAGNQSGFKNQRILVVNSDEYSEHNAVDYEGKRYSIYRIYKRSDGYTELYCAERIGNG